MKLTKFDHSCIVVEKDGLKIVCDPVEFTHPLPELNNVVAIIITHRHGGQKKSVPFLTAIQRRRF